MFTADVHFQSRILEKCPICVFFEIGTKVCRCFLKWYNTEHQDRNHGWARSPNYVASVFCYASPATGRFISHKTEYGVLKRMVVLYSL
jgi:hypothetical protein